MSTPSCSRREFVSLAGLRVRDRAAAQRSVASAAAVAAERKTPTSSFSTRRCIPSTPRYPPQVEAFAVKASRSSPSANGGHEDDLPPLIRHAE